MTPLDPIGIIDVAVRESSHVTITTHAGARLSGQPLHIGPKSVWIVVANADVFVPLTAIAAAETSAVTPEGVL